MSSLVEVLWCKQTPYTLLTGGTQDGDRLCRSNLGGGGGGGGGSDLHFKSVSIFLTQKSLNSCIISILLLANKNKEKRRCDTNNSVKLWTTAFLLPLGFF